MAKHFQDNTSKILKTIGDKKITRKDLSNIVKLTPAAISKIVSRLVEKKIIEETGEQVPTRNAGRKKLLIRMNKNYGYVIGIAIERNCITITLANLYKEHIDQLSKPISNPSVVELVNYIVFAVENLIKRNKFEKNKILGAGVAIVGLVDSNTGFSVHAYGLWNYPVALGDLLEHRLNIEVVVDNNVRALALAEIEAQEYSKDLIFIKYGPRIGSSLIIENEIYNGNSFQALEFGHIIIENDGLLCSCGQKGCLETVGSFVSIQKQLVATFNNTNILSSICGYSIDNVSLESILEAYNQGDTVVEETIESAIKYFTVALINLIKILDTKIVVLYGPFFKNDKVFQLLQNLISETGNSYNDQIKRSALNTDKSIGAISLARTRFFYNIKRK